MMFYDANRMASRDGTLDLTTVRAEREAFVLLQHLYTLGDADPKAWMGTEQVGRELDFSADEMEALISELARSGYVSRIGSAIAITLAGIDYIDRVARRRRSIRGVVGPRPPGSEPERRAG